MPSAFFCTRPSICVNVSLQVWHQTNNKKRALDKMPCDIITRRLCSGPLKTMAPPLFYFEYLWINLTGLTSFCFGNMFLLVLPDKKTKVERWHQISGEPLSITTFFMPPKSTFRQISCKLKHKKRCSCNFLLCIEYRFTHTTLLGVLHWIPATFNA